MHREVGMMSGLGLWSLFAVAVAAAGGGSAHGAGEPGSADAAKKAGASQAFSLARLMAERKRSGREWLEFLRVDSLSMGVYHLEKGAVDTQSPHRQDEVYYVASGRAVLAVDGQEHPVEAGSVVFVRANATHRFHSISEDLTMLVFFAPAETE
jgi:mannose-6-phosphate isomerase-like protein (cupin superfamily)